MIVRAEEAALLLVTQPDHAGLAGQIVEAWCAEDFGERPTRPSVLLATREHDNGWREEDAAPTVDPAGRPYDFISIPDAVKHRIWPRGVARVAALDPRAGALVAQHALRLFRDRRRDPAWSAFFAELERMRDELLATTGVTGPAGRAAFLQDYRLLYLGDLLSLVFCNGWTRPIEAEGYAIRLIGSVVEVAPDPFRGAVVPLRVAARRIAARAYSPDEALRCALADAERLELVGACRGGTGPQDLSRRISVTVP